MDRFGRATGGDPTGRFFQYSHFPVGQYLRRPGQTPAMTNMVQLTGAASGIRTPYRDLERAFEDAGFYRTLRAPYTSNSIPSRTITRWLIRALGDYVDTDQVPGTNGSVAGVFTLPCQEAVPMLNEIRVQNVYTCRSTANPTNYEFTIEPLVHVELWTPHTNLQNYARLSVQGDVTFTPRGWLTSKLQPQNAIVENAAPVAMRQREFRVVTNTIAWNKALFFTNNFIVGRSVTYDLTLANQRLRNLAIPAGRNEVDRVPGAFPTLSISNSLPAAPPPGGESRVTNTVVIECLDPRFNWDPRDRRQADPLWQWRVTNSPAMATLGGLNRWTQEYFADRRQNGCDSDDVMYCRDRGTVTVPGELGYLVYFPWKTVRLFDESGHTNYHSVLDTFTTTNATRVKGLVNPNSEYADVIASVFNEMPIDEFPSDPVPATVFRLGTNLAMRIGEAITNHTFTSFFVRISDLGNLTGVFGDANLLNSARATTEFRKEALLRNSASLFSTRQMMFTVLVASSYAVHGDSLGNEFIPVDKTVIDVDKTVVRSSERRVVSLFWFDTYTAAAYIRFFKFLDN